MKNTKKIFCIANALLIMSLCACNQAENEEAYVDISKVEEQIANEQLNIDVVDFTYDDKPYNIMRLTTTIDSEYFYSFNYPNIKINLESGHVQYYCNLAGCAHSELSSTGCMSWQDFCSPVAAADGIYYIDNDKVCCLDGENQITILKNTYSTDYEKEIYPDCKSIITALVIKDDLLYVVCPTYFFTYNLNTEMQTEPEMISTTACNGFCVGDEYIYYTTENLELYNFEIETKKITKLDDKIGQVCTENENLYYVKYENETPVLYVAELDGSDLQKLIEDCYVNYYVADSGIYYQSFLTKECYFYSFENNNAIKITFNSDSDKEYTPSDYLNIASTSSMEHIFIIDTNKNLLFIFENGNTESKTLETGKE